MNKVVPIGALLSTRDRQSLSRMEQAEKEARILATFNQAVSVAKERFMTVAERIKDIDDARTLKSVAAAFKISEDAQRAMAESLVTMQRELGLVLREVAPEGTSDVQLQAITGVSSTKCRCAMRLASYSEADLQAAFSALRKQGDSAHYNSVIAWFTKTHPRNTEKRQRDAAVRERRQARESSAKQRYFEWYESALSKYDTDECAAIKRDIKKRLDPKLPRGQFTDYLAHDGIDGMDYETFLELEMLSEIARLRRELSLAVAALA